MARITLDVTGRPEPPVSRDSVWSRTTPLRHMVQLDALRAIAAGMVLVYHFWQPARRYVPLGEIGVRVFFVLSGFLITGILLRSRALSDSGQVPAGVATRRFYARRFLRIFPLYYFALAIAYYFNVTGAREGIAWHAAYLTNVHFFVRAFQPNFEGGGHVAHFWSLAVEEQFYLIWPWVILFGPRRWLPGIALGLAAVGPVFRLVVFGLTGNGLTPDLLLGCVDSLALGAYLAIAVAPEFASHPLVRPISAAPLWAGLALYATYQVAALAKRFWLYQTVSFDLAVALAGLWLVSRAAEGMGGLAGRVLESRSLRYLGTISYGIYVYHHMLPEVLPQIALHFGHRNALAWLGDQTIPYLGFYTAATVIVAAASWHLFESPINRLKDRFAYC